MTEETVTTASAKNELRFATIEDGWQPPAPSTATRHISHRSRGSGRAILLATTSGDGGREREIRTEGLLELKILYLILADSRVENVWEQAGPVQYKDAEGKTHRHFFDFLVLLKDGRRIAIAVRPFERSQSLKETLKLIGAQMGHFADGYLLLTNQHVARDALHNVIRIHAARRGPRLGHDQKIRDIAATINGRIKISDLVKVSGLEGDGFRAIARLIGAGELQLCERGRITSAAYVTNPKGMDVRPCE